MLQKIEVLELEALFYYRILALSEVAKQINIYRMRMYIFRIVVEVAVSHVFFSWVFGFGGKVEIKGPQSVKEEYTMMVKKAYKNLLDLK